MPRPAYRSVTGRSHRHVALEEPRDLVEGLGRLVQVGDPLEHVGHVSGHLEGHLDVVAGGVRGEPDGVIEEYLARARLDQERRQSREVREDGTGRVLDIVREIAITVGAASKAVDRIEAAGWCRRRANPHDRRSSYLVLTDAGRQLLAAATPTFEQEIAGRLAGVVGEEERAQSGQTLAALRRALERQQRET